MRISILLLLISWVACGQDPYKNVYSRHAWKERDAWQRADDLIAFLKLDEGSRVADIGCHEGYMTFKLAGAVGETGMVYAVDVDESKLDKVRSSAQSGGVKNLTVIKGDYDNPKLPPNSLDAAIILDTYHEMDDHDEILGHLTKALKPKGRLVICEPIADSRRKQPRADQERRHELGMQYAIEDLKKAGFDIEFQKDPFVDRSKQKGDKMWVVVAVRRF